MTRSLGSGRRPFLTALRLPRVEQSDRLSERTRREVHVPERHCERRVSGEFLDRLRRRSAHCEVRAERVAKDMRADATEPSPLRSVSERGLDFGLGR